MVSVFFSKDKIREDKARQSCKVPHGAVHPALPNHPWKHRWVCAAEDESFSCLYSCPGEGPTLKVSSSS